MFEFWKSLRLTLTHTHLETCLRKSLEKDSLIFFNVKHYNVRYIIIIIPHSLHVHSHQSKSNRQGQFGTTSINEQSMAWHGNPPWLSSPHCEIWPVQRQWWSPRTLSEHSGLSDASQGALLWTSSWTSSSALSSPACHSHSNPVAALTF